MQATTLAVLALSGSAAALSGPPPYGGQPRFNKPVPSPSVTAPAVKPTSTAADVTTTVTATQVVIPKLGLIYVPVKNITAPGRVFTKPTPVKPSVQKPTGAETVPPVKSGTITLSKRGLEKRTDGGSSSSNNGLGSLGSLGNLGNLGNLNTLGNLGATGRQQ
ncbi:hypothetical protein CDD80_7517 [Ophiocordyceps camponoti-rufipedis]|uniref:Uncharacterized protein n=1 Tax=Ophiocordyceps camponoti-rufipedis TaxID=2004952 RepID=A0A2C5YL48_9HYPO|nr:hypothetical protein CDD80_7517 [Ophiocordyceps camponoti-rufipedis]